MNTERNDSGFSVPLEYYEASYCHLKCPSLTPMETVKTVEVLILGVGPWACYRTDRNRPARMFEDGKPGAHGPDGIRLHLGAIVATADLYDCVPVEMIHWTRSVETWCTTGLAHLVDVNPGQEPYGDFTPGRWA